MIIHDPFAPYFRLISDSEERRSELTVERERTREGKRQDKEGVNCFDPSASSCPAISSLPDKLVVFEWFQDRILDREIEI